MALCHLVDFELVLLAQLAHADVLAVHGPTEAADGHHGAILLPAGAGDRVVVLDLFDAGLLVDALVDALLEELELVEVQLHDAVAAGALVAARELLHTAVLGIVQLVDQFALQVLEGHLQVQAGDADVSASRDALRNRGVVQQFICLVGVSIDHHHRQILVSGDDEVRVRN